MTSSEAKIFLFISPDTLPALPRQVQNFGINFIHKKCLDEAFEHEELKPDVIFSDCTFGHLSGGDVVFQLKSRWKNVPIIIMSEEYNTNLIHETFEAGAFNFLKKPLAQTCFLNAILQSRYMYEEEEEYLLLLKNMIKSETYLQEKSTILETILDILSHDSKNLFVNLKSLIDQLPQDPISGMLNDSLDELIRRTMEAVTYLKSGKRIQNILEIIKDLKLTKDRITLSSHHRIKLVHPMQSLLYVETTALIKNAIGNIVENALKYSPEESPIIIKVQREDNTIRVDVIDQGKGIPDKDKANIFQRYYRLKQHQSVEGSGRGLWITQNIISKEGGTVTISDNQEGSTVFSLTLPTYHLQDFEQGVENIVEWYKLTPDVVHKKARTVRTILQLQELDKYADFDSIVYANLLDYIRKESRNKNQKHFQIKLNKYREMNPQGKKVLIVDDSLYVHYYLGSYLSELGYHVVDYAKNGADAVSLFHIHKPDFITMDFTMPIMTGPEAAKIIHEQDKNVVILFITGLGEHETFIKRIPQSIPDLHYAILTKPFKKEALRFKLLELGL